MWDVQISTTVPEPKDSYKKPPTEKWCKTFLNNYLNFRVRWGEGGAGGRVHRWGVCVGVREQTRVSWGHDREGGVGVGMPRSVNWGLISSNTHRNVAHDDLVSEERGHTGRRLSVASVCLSACLTVCL